MKTNRSIESTDDDNDNSNSGNDGNNDNHGDNGNDNDGSQSSIDRQSITGGQSGQRKQSMLKSSREGQSKSPIQFPGKVDRQAGEDLEKCLKFYHQMKEHFDDDIAAMLFKCCLCYGNCSNKN